MAHAKLSPSARGRWQLCPASVKANLKYESDEGSSSAAAIDGTHSHTLLEYCVKHKDGLSDAKQFIGMILGDHEGQFAVCAERATRVQLAIDYIRSQLADGVEVIAERQVNPAALTGRNDMTGTVDIQLRSQSKLVILDYKDGMQPVDARDNPQMEQYAFGVLAEYMQHAIPWPPVIELGIIQPKLTTKGMLAVSTHSYTLDEFVKKLPALIDEAEATDAPNAPFVAGEKQCQWCPNKGNCSEASSYVLKKAGIKFEAVPIPNQAANADVNSLTDQQLREMVESAPMLRKMLESAEEEALRRISTGHPVEGLKIVRGVGRRAWSKEESDIADKLKRMAVPKSEIWQTKLISPAQVQKLTWTNTKGEQKQLSPKQLEMLNTEFIVKGTGNLTVVPESDRRDAMDFGNMKELFAAVPAVPVIEVPSWLLTS